MSISDIVFRNELAFENKRDIKDQILYIFNVMLDGVYKGCHKTGALPGGLNVKRRAKAISENLLGGIYYPEKDAWMNAIKALDQDRVNPNTIQRTDATPGYTIHNVFARKQIIKNLDLNFRVENIGNTMYRR